LQELALQATRPKGGAAFGRLQGKLLQGRQAPARWRVPASHL